MVFANERLQIVVKLFSECAKEFSVAAALAIRQLAQLDLPIQILGLLDNNDNTHVFWLGESSEKANVIDIYSLDQIHEIESSLDKLGLKSAFPDDSHLRSRELDIVMIDGKQHVVDPIEDSYVNIEEYLTKRRIQN